MLSKEKLDEIPAMDSYSSMLSSPYREDNSSSIAGEHTLVTLTPTPPAQRTPVFIPSSGKKSSGTMRLPKGRRTVINIGAAIVLIMIIIGALAAVIPTSSGNASGFLGLFRSDTHSVAKPNNQTSLIMAQSATATAVMQDGYDAGGNIIYAGVNRDYSLGNGQSTLNIASGGAQSSNTAIAGGKVSAANLVIHATPGQCTWWAQYRYWQLTGYEVPWAGNASTYADQALAYHWLNSSVPVLHSIIVLQPGIQYAGLTTGHVGVVERINSDGSVYVSSWNIVAPGVETDKNYYTGYGVSFVYHP